MYSTTDVAPTRCLVNELAERPGQAKFRGEAATLSSVTHSREFDPAITRSSVAGINHWVRARDMWKTEVSRAIQ